MYPMCHILTNKFRMIVQVKSVCRKNNTKIYRRHDSCLLVVAFIALFTVFFQFYYEYFLFTTFPLTVVGLAASFDDVILQELLTLLIFSYLSSNNAAWSLMTKSSVLFATMWKTPLQRTCSQYHIAADTFSPETNAAIRASELASRCRC